MSIDAADRPAVAHFVRTCGAGVVATHRPSRITVTSSDMRRISLILCDM
jgi:hypothetical protein